jgi:hypothetical protein
LLKSMTKFVPPGLKAYITFSLKGKDDQEFCWKYLRNCMGVKTGKISSSICL